MQAVCDQKRRITYLSVLASGSTHDMQAFSMCWLGKTLADPNHEFNNTGFSIYGDPAYQGMANRCRSLLTPFTRPHVTERQDAFNYFHSSSRMSIEGAFGELINRWGILSQPLKVGRKRWGKLLLCLCHLHNVCVDAGFRADKRIMARMRKTAYMDARISAMGITTRVREHIRIGPPDGDADDLGADSPDWRVCTPSTENRYFDWDGRGNFQDRLAYDLFGRDRSIEGDVKQPIREAMADAIEEAGWRRATDSNWSYVK